MSITFNLKDLPLAEKLKDVLGYGWIRIKQKENACVLTFHTIKGLIYIVSLMNSYLRTPKLNKFNKLIDILNQKEGLSIDKYSVQLQDFKKDSWLVGFIDADGSFGIINTNKETDELGKTTKKRRVACRFRIDQRMHDPLTNESYEPLFKSIASFLGVNVTVVKKNTGKEYFNVTAKSRESISIVRNYLNMYPLFSSKYHDFKDWDIVVELILKQTHYNEENYDLIEKLKNGMNTNRVNINWAHLNRLGKITGPTLFSSFVALLEQNKKLKGRQLINTSSVSLNDNNKLSSYLAGLFEGDGHIWIQKQKGAKTHNPRFCITFGTVWFMTSQLLCHEELSNYGDTLKFKVPQVIYESIYMYEVIIHVW